MSAVRIDGERTFQAMEGFGTSERPFEDPHLFDQVPSLTGPLKVVVPDAARGEIMDRLYAELGLTRVRPVLPGRGMQPTKADRIDFSGVRNDAHVDYVKEAVRRGATTYFNSPLQLEAWMGEGRPEEYVDWAMAIVRRWRELGLDLPYHAVINEPGYKRSGIWSGEFLRDVIKMMGPRLRDEGFATRFVLPDDLNASEADRRSRVVLADPEARRYVAVLGFHLYDEPIENVAKMKELGRQHGLPLWMTEWSRKDPFEWANTVHTLVADYDVSAVDHMWGFFGQYEAAGRALLLSIEHDDDGVYTGYTLLKHYYVFGQYTRFVRPGARRVEATSTDPEVKVSAVADGPRAVIVAINHGAVDKLVDGGLRGFPGVASLIPVRTSRTEDWAPSSPVEVAAGRFTVTLPASSVTTLS